MSADRGHGLVGLIGLVARREYLRTVRRKGFLVGTALVPLGAIALLIITNMVLPSGSSTASGPDTAPQVIYLVNDSPLRLPAAPPPGMPVTVVTRSAALDLLERRLAPEVYALPADYLSSGRIERIVPSSAPLDLTTLDRRGAAQRTLGAYLRTVLIAGSGLSPDVAARIVAPGTTEDVTPGGRPAGSGADPSAATFLIPYAFSLLFIMSIFITSGYLLQSVSEEKENRVVEIVLSSVPALPLMAGKILGLGGAGLTQVGIWIATALVAIPVAGARIPALGSFSLGPAVLLVAVAYFVLGYLAYGAIFAAIGAVAPGTREAQQYSGFMSLFGALPLVFTGAFLSDPGSPLCTALTLIPLTAPGSSLQVLALRPELPWVQVGLSLVLLAGFAALATVASARIFRATLLLYGVRPGLRRLVAAVVARG